MPRPGLRPRCFFDVEIVGQARGRIVFELFADICPKTCDNFRALCNGEMGTSKISGKPLHYKGAPFHRIVKNFMIQGGDFTSGDGTGGESMYGKTFPDENFELNHDRDMLLSMANRGKDTNGSQFFITTQPAPHLDGIHVVFGQVIQGQPLVKQIENQKVDSNSRPYNDVIIINCGELVPQKRKSRPKKRKPSVSLSEDTSSSESESSSDSDSDTSDSETDSIERMKKQRRKAKKRKAKRKLEKKGKKKKKKIRKRGGSESEEEEGRQKPKYHSTVRPDEIPDIPRPRFLYRGSPQRRSDEEVRRSPPPRFGRRRTPERVPYNSREFMSKSGRRIKGRGTIRYRTPTRSSSRERSATPPHWRREQEKLRHLDRRARFEQDDDRWLKGDKLRGSNQQGNTIISRKLRAQMAAESFRRGEYDDDEIPRPGKPRSIDLGGKGDARLERKLRRKEKKLKKKLKKEKKQKKRRKQPGSESEVDVSSPEQPMYREPGRVRQPGPVSMSPMHTDPRSQLRERELEWEQDEVEFSRSRQIKSPSVSDGSPPREQHKTNGRNNRSRSLSPLVREMEEDPYGGKKGMKSFQIKTSKKEPKVLKDDGKRTMFQDQSSSEQSSKSRSPSPKRRSRFEEVDEELSPSNPLSCLAKIKPITMEPTAPAMVSVLPRGDSESPPPTHWKPGQKTWRPKREIIRKEIERRLRTVGSKKDKDPELPRTRSPSPEDEIMSASSEQSGDEGPRGSTQDPGKSLSNSQGSGSLVPPGGEKEHSKSPGSSRSGLQPKSPEPEPPRVKKTLVSKWEPPEEPDDGEIVEEPDGVQQEPPAKVSLIKTPPLPDITQIAVENQLILRKSDTGGATAKSNLSPKVSVSAPMVPRNIAMAQKSQSGQLQKSPGHVPKPPSTPPRTPAEASRPPLPIQPPLPTSQPPKPPGLPVPPKLPPRPPGEPPKPSGPATRLHGLPPKPLAERIGAIPARPTSRNLRTRPRTPTRSRSRSRSYSRSRSRSGRLTPPHRRRSYSHTSRSYSRSVSRSPRRRHSYSRSTSRSRSPRRSRDRYRRSHTTSTSGSRSPGGRRYSRSVSRSYSRSSRSYSRSRSRSHSPRRRRYSSDSYSD